MKKIDNNIFFVKNKDFQTLQIKMIFPFYDTVEDMAHLTILPSMVAYMNEEFDTEESFIKNRQKRYILATGCAKNIIGTNVFFSYSLIMPTPKALGFDVLEEQFDFFEKFVYHPKIVNGGFDEFELEREKTDLKYRIANGMKNLRIYQGLKVVEAFDTEGVASRNVQNHAYLIDEVTPSSLYEFYQKNIYNNDPIVFIFGDVEEDRIKELVEKYLVKDKKKEISYEVDYNHFLEPRKEINIVNDKGCFKDSSISLVYKVKDMCEDDILMLGLISSLLSSLSSRLLQKVLRDEHELVYSTNSCSYLRSGALEITAFIHKDNKDIVIEKIKEVIESLKDPSNIEEFLNNIIDRRRLNLLKLLDDKYGLLDDVICKNLGFDDLASEQYEIIKNYKAEDVSKFVERLVLDTIFFIEEEDNE